MTWCIYQRTGDGTKAKHAYVCLACGHTRESNHPPERLHRRCGAVRRRSNRIRVHTPPGELLPDRDDDEINFILETLCNPCPKRENDHCKCTCRGFKLTEKTIRKGIVGCPDLKW